MKRVLAFLAVCAPALAAISGTVINGTTGQPQPGAAVTLMTMGAAGPEETGGATADAQGKFSLNAQVSAQGPTLLRATLDGVTYTQIIPPGTPSEGVTLQIYNASKDPGPAKVSKHLIFFDPTDKGLVINEAYLFSNSGKTAWNDPANGTLRFFLPAGAQGKVQINATAPGGMPLPESALKTDKADIYKVNFPVRPGETRFDLNYTTPYTAGAPYAGKIASRDDNTYLIVPKGVTLTGDNLSDMGQEPRTEAHLYGLKDTAFKISLTGTAQPSAADADTSADSGGQDPGNQITEIMPRILNQKTSILALALGILALGFILLYRSSASSTATPSPLSREPNERSRG
ncbi:MAG: carboxypeptidase-like regulatory domain-containing protein [Acidobacteriia bacterium]|nr:carboxypeptidase-like regulatory domain-containing protein [Terriglobia bacterium]